MIANIKNPIAGEDLSLKLVRIGERLSWRDLDTGALYGSLYPNIKTAVLGLTRYHSDPGSDIRFMKEPGDFGPEEVVAA